MHSGLAATRAVLHQFQTIRVVPAVLLGDVVTLLALAARQGDLRADVGRLAGHSYLPLCLGPPDQRHFLFQSKLKSSEGGVRTRDLTIMSRALSPTELPRRLSVCLNKPQSPDRDLNPGPSPYHGDALPTELSGQQQTYLLVKWILLHPAS